MTERRDERCDPLGCDTAGCDEYHALSRRRFLALAAATTAGAALPGWLPRVVLADSEDTARDVLVSVFLRGGADALTLVAPYAEAAYRRLRPNLHVPPPDAAGGATALDLDGFFALPPAMAPLLDAYRAGDLAIVHACGLDGASRSHFEAMHTVEVGVEAPPASLATGWLGRHLAAVAPTRRDAVLRALSIGGGLPRTLAGAPSTLPVQDPATFGLAGPQGTVAARREALAAMYAQATTPLATGAAATLDTLDLLGSIDFAGYRPAGGAAYPESDFGRALAAVAALIRADVGLEAAAVDLGGWDTHELQGSLDGQMHLLMQDFAAAVAAFHADLEAAGRRDVTLTALSEFGRNAFENGSGGTDHGHGGVMFVVGGAVAGGRVHGTWPGLEEGQLYEGQDLAVTTDYRDVLVEILGRRLGNPDPAAVFADPAYAPRPVGVVAEGA